MIVAQGKREKMREIRWHGRGGQGGFTAARLLGMAASLSEDYYVQAFPSFGPERRGAPVLAFQPH
jgi:pyruvate ferredoxin oxidoreductase gamma subunit